MAVRKKSRKRKSPIGPVKEGAFKRWLGKSENARVTEADIEKGLHSRDPHVRKMANFARNARKWKHKRKRK